MNTEIRELDVAELDLVSGGGRVAVELPGQVSVSVWLAGKEYAYGGGDRC